MQQSESTLRTLPLTHASRQGHTTMPGAGFEPTILTLSFHEI